MAKHKVFRDSDSESEDGEPSSLKHEIADEVDEESNEDGEPESVTFKDSKKNVLDHVRFALRQIEQDKQQTKDKRRKRDAVFKEQKKQKLARLESRRLPEDILETVASRQNEPVINSSVVALRTEDKDVLDCGNNGSKEEDYIPLNGSVITAINSKHISRLSSKSQSALDFRHRQLYGKSIPREPASAILAKRAKKAALRSS